MPGSGIATAGIDPYKIFNDEGAPSTISTFDRNAAVVDGPEDKSSSGENSDGGILGDEKISSGDSLSEDESTAESKSPGDKRDDKESDDKPVSQPVNLPKVMPLVPHLRHPSLVASLFVPRALPDESEADEEEEEEVDENSLHEAEQSYESTSSDERSLNDSTQSEMPAQPSTTFEFTFTYPLAATGGFRRTLGLEEEHPE
ncbi:hypothetical protein PHLGIDRAFT_123482 [Phlebiopsis gigantea 11061_1 CR5-6]|uniref:Uncharacterized protein n=1 Tax=Phlebiopsis gigantea (strain 11061_1 CR5-6) TaxID=745531 RepID=A0A0C3P9G8_PHLG1|nr:hypothetical protein PHLGIDRAFT_123482 [Phlebiopsis gigantea 11061_1 CR5-6]